MRKVPQPGNNMIYCNLASQNRMFDCLGLKLERCEPHKLFSIQRLFATPKKLLAECSKVCLSVRLTEISAWRCVHMEVQIMR